MFGKNSFEVEKKRIIAVVGSGGKTTWIRRMSNYYREQGKKVFVTTSTHMFREADTLVTENADEICNQLKENGYVMAGSEAGKCKIGPLPYEVLKTCLPYADIVFIEADGSKHMPVKYPNDSEPVIYPEVNEIVIITGLQALGYPLREVAHRLPQTIQCLQIQEDALVTPIHVQKLLREGYIDKLSKEHPGSSIEIKANHDGSLYQRALAGLLAADVDVTQIKEEWFQSEPCLFICGGGHVAKALADLAAHLNFRIKVMDDRPEFASQERFPMAEQVICDSFDHLCEYMEPNAIYVVVSRGHQDDYNCVKQILGFTYSYLGMIGSKKKVNKTFERLEFALREQGMDINLINTIHAPIGLSIGAVSPGEIAISILAEIIQEKNKVSTAFCSKELLNSEQTGKICIIIEKTGSSPRGVGSMMLVGNDFIIDSIGGGSVEAAVIQDARDNDGVFIKEYQLNTKDSRKLGMICGGSNKILFIPV